ncbi:MAG: hypothetical protein IIB08_09005, partial [Bacteroidetes bacterium]|nr:hypothetical protein [Bacteroidota bacterium]
IILFILISISIFAQNPYLDEFNKLPLSYHRNDEALIHYGEKYRESLYGEVRSRLVTKYSWAVPTETAIDAITIDIVAKLVSSKGAAEAERIAAKLTLEFIEMKKYISFTQMIILTTQQLLLAPSPYLQCKYVLPADAQVLHRLHRGSYFCNAQ